MVYIIYYNGLLHSYYEERRVRRRQEREREREREVCYQLSLEVHLWPHLKYPYEPIAFTVLFSVWRDSHVHEDMTRFTQLHTQLHTHLTHI